MENMLPFEKMKREIFVRKKAETSPKFGKRPEQRTTKELLELGIVVIDKPAGPTSHQISGYVRQMLHLSKAGHSGTLDPNVTGVLPVALAKATKVVQALLPAGKEYICILHLHNDFPEQKIRDVCASFIGKIKQLPPLKSAVKREWRYRKIYYLNVLEVDGRDVLFQVGCQAGTYIRKLCDDIGIALGSRGHMQELRRTKAGMFKETDLCTMQDVADAFWYYKNEKNDTLLRKYVKPMEAGVGHLPKVWVFDTTVNALCHGASLKVPGISMVESDIQVDDFIAIMSLKNELVAFGKSQMISKDMQKKDKGLAVKIERVFMDPGIYPKMG